MQFPRDVASISSAAASLIPIAAISSFISVELTSMPCRPYMAEARSRMVIVSVHRVSFSVRAPTRGRTYRGRNRRESVRVSMWCHIFRSLQLKALRL